MEPKKQETLPVPIRRNKISSNSFYEHPQGPNYDEITSSSISLPCSTSIPLLPFGNQVGGHGAILKFSDKTILKHMDEGERRFYEAVDKWYPQLSSFIPTYYGLVDVNYTACDSPDSSGSIVLQPEINSQTSHRILKTIKNGKKFSRKAAKSLISHKRTQSADTRSSSVKDDFVKKNANSIVRSKSDSILEPFSFMTVTKQVANPWSLHLYKEEFEYDKVNPSNIQETKKYLILEDLTFGLKTPCILDLKMGTRLYGLHASNAKIRSQLEKSENSTSMSLGVRICGMQVYQSNIKKYLFQSKYDGRKLDPISFKETLWKFVNNGQKYLTELIPQIIEKLELLKNTISSLKNFRFYSSSLLVIYDGSVKEPIPLQISSSSAPPVLLRASSVGRNLQKGIRKVDVRMIDFAQSVVDIDEGELEDCPDLGYILGLDTLISCFKELEYACLVSKK